MTNQANSNLLNMDEVIRDPTLSLFQKVLLASDGTVTQLLEIYTSTTINVKKLAQQMVQQDQPKWLQTNTSSALLKRRILLCNDQHNLIHAESYFVIDRLPPTMHQALLDSNQPIGMLWRAERLETYREIVEFTRQPEPSLARYFDVADDEQFLGRTYLISHQQQPLGLITEKFPASHFRK